jgi:hypothetical protein
MNISPFFQTNYDKQVADKIVDVQDVYKFIHDVATGKAVLDLDNFEFVSKAIYEWWLEQAPDVFKSEEEWRKAGMDSQFFSRPPFDIYAALCQHGRIGMDKLSYVKCVPEVLVSSQAVTVPRFQRGIYF